MVLAALTAGCLAGCGDKAGSGGEQDASGGVQDGTTAQENTGAQDDADGQGSADDTGAADSGTGASGTALGKDTTKDNGDVKLKFWCDADEQELFQEMINAFIAEHKSEANISVEYETVGASICKDTLLSDINNGADVFSMPDDQLLTLVAAGVLEPVENGTEIASQNLEGAVEAASVNGSLYAYPLTADNGYFLYYDKQYFSESDVQTLDRILEICEQNNKKFVMDWTSGWYLYSFFGNTGMTLALNDDGLTNSCDWNSTENNIKGVDVAQAMLDISASPAFWNYNDFPNAVSEGGAIAVVSGVWDINTMKEAFGDYGAAKLPTYTCAGQQVQMASFTGYRLLGVNSYGKHTGWAAKLAEYLSSEESQTLRFERAERGPSNKVAASSDAVNEVPAIRAVLEQSEYGTLQKIGQKYWVPTTAFGTTMAEGNPNGTALQDIVDQLVSGITQ